MMKDFDPNLASRRNAKGQCAICGKYSDPLKYVYTDGSSVSESDGDFSEGVMEIGVGPDCFKNITKKSIRIILSERGTKQHTEELKNIHVPDIWHLIESAPNKNISDQLAEVWHLAHDLLGALRSIESGADFYNKPVHTK